MYDETQNNRWAARCHCGALEGLVGRRMHPMPNMLSTAVSVCRVGHVRHVLKDAHVLDWRHANRHQKWQPPFNTGRGNHE